MVIVRIAGFENTKVRVVTHFSVPLSDLQIGKRVFWEDPRSGEIIIGKITDLEYAPVDENCKIKLTLYNGQKVVALPKDLSIK